MATSEIIRFASPVELIKHATSACEMADRYRASLTGTEAFTGTKSFAEAVEVSRRGWRGGTDMINKLSAEVAHSIAGQLPVKELQYRIRGQHLNVGRYMQGSPKPYSRLIDTSVTRESYAPKNVRIVVNIAASGAINEETYLRRGAAAVVLVDTLEARRIRCQVDLVDVTTNKLTGGDTLEVYTTVKQYADAVSIDRLAFFAAHRSSLRRIGLAVVEHCSEATRTRFGIGTDKGAYGLPGVASEQGSIYVDRIISPSDWSPDFTMMWLKQNLAAQGITLAEEVN